MFKEFAQSLKNLNESIETYIIGIQMCLSTRLLLALPRDKVAKHVEELRSIISGSRPVINNARLVACVDPDTEEALHNLLVDVEVIKALYVIFISRLATMYRRHL